MVNRFPRGDPHQHQQWEDFRRGGPMAFDMQARWADPAPAPRAWPWGHLGGSLPIVGAGVDRRGGNGSPF